MRVLISADMEGVSQLQDLREVLACSTQYWATGKAALTADVAAATEGLLAGGASEVVVLDNHGSGNPLNIAPDDLPVGARLETWDVFDLHEHDVQAMLQVGYHPRCGVDGFMSHTYIPRLRLRVGDELISESHGRTWAAGVPLIGIVGNADHRATLGSLVDAPFLVVQTSEGRTGAQPAFTDAGEGAAAIRAFARERLEDRSAAVAPPPPRDVPFMASLPDGPAREEQMRDAGWTRVSDTEFRVELRDWPDARAPLAGAMYGAMSPFLPLMSGLDLTSAESVAAQDLARVSALEDAFLSALRETEDDWLG